MAYEVTVNKTVSQSQLTGKHGHRQIHATDAFPLIFSIIEYIFCVFFAYPNNPSVSS